LDIFGRVRRSVEAADAEIAFAIEDRRDVLVTLLSEVALNYMDLRGFQRQIAIAQKNLETQRRSLDLTRRRAAGGFVSGLDVANAEADVASNESRIPLLEQNVQQVIYSLSVLLGREPGALLNELTAEAPIPATPPAVPVGLPSELLRRRPDIRRAEANLHAATARIGVATADLFPRFSLTGSLGTSGSQPKDLVNWDNRFWSIGPSVSWPIFDAGKIRANIGVQTAIQEQAIVGYRSTVLIALQDVENALIAYAKEQQHQVALVAAVTANRRAVDLATQLYTQGQTNFLDVLLAQRSLLGSEDALVQSERTMATNLISLYKALGGGWEISP
jgi:NodT family efflux transporter outer membrane factor (OMF) lipoprotein